MSLPVAAISGVLVTIATHVIRSLGYAGLGLLVGMSAVIALPGTELPSLFAGFNVYQHHLTLVGVIVAGALGDVIGACVAYTIGRYASVELIERHGAKFHAKPEDLERAHGWFERYGTWTIMISRWLPVVRAAFPYAAGVARMSFWRFLLMASIGSIVWIGALCSLGDAVGRQWQTWKHHLDYVDYAGIAILVVLIVWGIVRWVRRAREDDAAARAAREDDAAARADVARD
ncbi:MAG TPA: DedA family protein [Solirubrobacteraceae bacterium]|jgi:membrane protein DedA with SNARE-associated domain